MKIIIPLTNRAHHGRMKLLIDELKKEFEVDIFTPKMGMEGDIETYAITTAIEFKNYIAGKKYDLALVRADRFELLLLAGICAYRGIKIAHIEGGAESGGVIDTQVRDAITKLANLHFVTDDAARKKVTQLVGLSDKVWNVGSLDVSFAAKNFANPPIVSGEYILFLHHGIPGEDSKLVYEAVKELDLPIVGVKSNTDYSASLMHEEYSPEDFISLMSHAMCFVGNSSALCKESSIIGVPAVLVGTRQDGRVVGRNVMRVRHDKNEIVRGIKWQMFKGKYAPDHVYYKKGTEKMIVKILKKELHD